MTIEQLIKFYEQRREILNEEMQKGSKETIVHDSEWLIKNCEWLILYDVIRKLSIIKLRENSKYTFDQFESHFMQTLEMFKENSLEYIDQSAMNLSTTYHVGYLQAIQTVIKAFNYSSNLYLMKNGGMASDLSDQE